MAETAHAPKLPAHPWPALPKRLPFDSNHYATPRLPSERVIRTADKLTLIGAESLESCLEQAMLARRLTAQRATVTTRVHFAPESFQQMAGLAAYYNHFLFHYLYLSRDEELGLCLQIHSCDEGVSSFPLGPTPVAVPQSDLYLRMVFADRELRFPWSTDGASFHAIGPVLAASLLSDENGKHWGFTGTFVALACQDLTGSRLPADFDFLEIIP